MIDTPTQHAADRPADHPLQVRRLAGNPIIRPEMLGGEDGRNINGPTLIRVPDWVAGAMGRYTLYFADHSGRYIRLAWANRLNGPWTIHAPGALHMRQVGGFCTHIASPDIVVLPDSRTIRMYYHVYNREIDRQVTYVSDSPDGLHFSNHRGPIGPFYFRVFAWRGRWFALAKGGQLLAGDDGIAFTPMHNVFGAARDEHANEPGPRHVAVQVAGSTLWVYFSSIGDCPERICRGRIDLAEPPQRWQVRDIQEVLRPEMPWEGADLPMRPSVSGYAPAPEHALRDPHVYVEGGRRFLLYSVAGESGIAIAEIIESDE